MTRHLLTTVNGKIVLLVFKITWAKIWCAYNAPSKYSKHWQWHKKLTSFPYGNHILMQTNWGKKFQPHSGFVYSRKQAKLFDTLACLYEVKKWSFLIHLFFLGGGGWGGGKFHQSVPLFPTASLFPEEKKHWKIIQSLLSLLSQALYIQTSSFLCAGLIFCSSCYLLPWWGDSLTILHSSIVNSILHSIDGSLCWLLYAIG